MLPLCCDHWLAAMLRLPSISGLAAQASGKAATVIGFAAVPDAPTDRASRHSLPQIRRTVSPAANAVKLSLASVRQGPLAPGPAVSPLLVSLPALLST